MYCGNERTPKWLNEYMSWLFDSACKLHDFFYGAMLDLFGHGYVGKKASRILADFFFLIHMLSLILVMQIKVILAIPTAPLMFLGVLFFGGKSYKKAEDKQL